MPDQEQAERPERAGDSPPASAASSPAERNETEAQREEREAEERVERDLDELAAAKRERDEYLQLAQRTKADFENYRKRVARETTEALARGKADLARQLLPALDNLERALAAGADASTHDALVKGVAMVRDELHSRLQSAGVEPFDPTGERFDPQLHEALSTMPSEGTESGVVLETVEKGYRLDGQVLRAAKVVVSQ
ncbi:MAG TPA: nucleotide exchange factor GrpE [Solirubrobacterales bacterium]|nr:nucleotide exchange factor GrpE [Solirubrobacterales bacterium]